jgi:glyoxylase-like metal-dependent hydrolase (beta-lactamase superfamily II)
MVAERQIIHVPEKRIEPIRIGPDSFVVNGPGFGFIDSANALLVGNILFDPGSESSLPSLWKSLTALRKLPDTIVFTHPHVDHVGSISLLLDMLAKHGVDAKAYGSNGTRDVIGHADPLETAAFLYPGTQFNPFRVTGELHDGEEIEFGEIQIRAIAAPGHTSSHMAYRVNDHNHIILVAGDAVGGGIDTRLGSDLDRYNETCLRLYEEEAHSVIRGHGEPDTLITKDELARFARTKSDLKPGKFYNLMDPVN